MAAAQRTAADHAAAARGRRREVAAALAAAGLGPGVRRIGDPPEGLGARLAEALPPLGPAFALLAGYLATRVDVLGLAECEALDRLALDRPWRGGGAGQKSVPWPEVQRLLVGELGASPEERFAEIDPLPARTGVVDQVHRARALDGRPLEVQLLRPGIAGEIEAELPLLDLVAPCLPARGVPAAELLADFRDHLETRLDLGSGAAITAALADGPPADGIAVLRSLAALSTPRIATTEAIAGGTGIDPGAGDLAPARRDELARRLCRFWLAQVFFTRHLPVAAEPLLTPDGRLALAGLRFAPLPFAGQARLRDYVEAMAADDPDRACENLIGMLEPAARGAAPEELRKAMRQLVPRHHEPVGSGGDGLAGHLLGHWRLARRAGLRPVPHLREAYRGVVWLSRTARRLSAADDPLRDPLREALEDLRWRGGFDQARQLADPQRMAELFERYLAAMSVLPQRIERALAAPPAAEPPADGGAAPRGDDAPAAAGALGLAMAAVALVGERLAGMPGAPPSIGRWSAALFLALGGWMLWMLGGRR